VPEPCRISGKVIAAHFGTVHPPDFSRKWLKGKANGCGDWLQMAPSASFGAVWNRSRRP